MDSKNLIREIEFEVISTSKLHELIPKDKLAWKPHERAMALGELAFHVAIIPGNSLSFADRGKTKLDIFLHRHIPGAKEEIIESFPDSITKARKVLEGATGGWAIQIEN